MQPTREKGHKMGPNITQEDGAAPSVYDASCSVSIIERCHERVWCICDVLVILTPSHLTAFSEALIV